jgi:hypothetical protein
MAMTKWASDSQFYGKRNSTLGYSYNVPYTNLHIGANAKLISSNGIIQFVGGADISYLYR